MMRQPVIGSGSPPNAYVFSIVPLYGGDSPRYASGKHSPNIRCPSSESPHF